QQRVGVGEDDGVVVDVDDPCVGCGALGHLVGVVGGRQARADVQELPHPLLGDQEADGSPEEETAGVRDVDQPGEDLLDLLADLPVDLVVVLAADEVVPEAGRVRPARIDPGTCLETGTVLGDVLRHGWASYALSGEQCDQPTSKRLPRTPVDACSAGFGGCRCAVCRDGRVSRSRQCGWVSWSPITALPGHGGLPEEQGQEGPP